MDLDIIKADQSRMPKANPLIANGFSYERMKDAPAYIDSVLKSAFDTLKVHGFIYHGYDVLPLHDSLIAMSRTCRRSSKLALEITHTSSFPIACKLEFIEPTTGARRVFKKNTHVTFLNKGNEFFNNGASYIVSPKLGDRVFSLDRDCIFVSISRSKMVFIRTPYFFRLDGRVVSTDIHRAKLYYETSTKSNDVAKSASPDTIPTLVNYMLCEHGLVGMFKNFYGVDVKAVNEDDAVTENYPPETYTICRSHGRVKGRNIYRTNIAFIFKNEQMVPDLIHVIAATYFIMDVNSDTGFFSLNNLNNPTSWQRALANAAITEDNELAAIEKVESHIDSVKAYIDHATKIKFRKENLDINTIFDLFMYIIRHFPMIAATHNVASMENKVLSITPHFLFNLTSSIFRMMFVIKKEAVKKNLSCQQVEKLLQSHWKEEAALSRITSLTNVRSMDHATDCMLMKATRIMVPQASRGAGSKQMAEMNNPAFAHHYSKAGIISYQFVNKSSPTAIDSINPMAKLTYGDVLVPHDDALPIVENMKELTGEKSTLKDK